MHSGIELNLKNWMPAAILVAWNTFVDLYHHNFKV